MHSVLKNSLIAAALLLSANLTFAAQAKPEAKGSKGTPGKVRMTPVKPAAKGKGVDINSATREELKQLPGVTDAYAGQIIAGRPYRTKAHLLTRKVIPEGLYASLKARIIAKQTSIPTS